MRRFLRHMGLFLLPIVLVAIGLEIVAESIPNSYTYKREYMERHGGEIQTLILGSSYAYDGLAPAMLPEAFNLANSSQTLEDDYYLLERYIDSMDSLHTVIIPVGYGIWADRSEAHRRCYYTIYMDLYPRWPLNKYSFEVFNLELLTKKIIKYAISRDVTRCDSLGQRLGHSATDAEPWNKSVGDLVANDAIDSRLLTIDSSMSNVQCPISNNIEYLCEMIQLCSTHHVQPVIVTMPVMREYKAALPPEQIALHDSIMRTLPASAIYIDASDWQQLTDGWYNATHLTREASVEFTRKVWEIVNGYDNH